MPWISVLPSIRLSVCTAVGAAGGAAVVSSAQPRYSPLPTSHNGQITFTSCAAAYQYHVKPAAALAEVLFTVSASHRQNLLTVKCSIGAMRNFVCSKRGCVSAM